MLEANALVARLRGDELRCRTGILFLPDLCLGREAEVAARLGIQHVDLAAYVLERVPVGGKFLNLSAGKIFDHLDDIANAHSGMDVVLIANADIAVMRLTSADRAQLWESLLKDFPNRKKALLLAIPEHKDGIRVLQEEPLRHTWEQAGRLGKWSMEHRGQDR